MYMYKHVCVCTHVYNAVDTYRERNELSNQPMYVKFRKQCKEGEEFKGQAGHIHLEEEALLTQA